MQLAEEGELVQDVHLLVEAAFLGQVADASQDRAGEGPVEERDRAGVGHGDADHHADGAGLARAVGAEQAEHRPRLDGEGEVLHRDLGVVDLANVLKLDDGHGRPRGEARISLAAEGSAEGSTMVTRRNHLKGMSEVTERAGRVYSAAGDSLHLRCSRGLGCFIRPQCVTHRRQRQSIKLASRNIGFANCLSPDRLCLLYGRGWMGTAKILADRRITAVPTDG